MSVSFTTHSSSSRLTGERTVELEKVQQRTSLKKREVRVKSRRKEDTTVGDKTKRYLSL